MKQKLEFLLQKYKSLPGNITDATMNLILTNLHIGLLQLASTDTISNVIDLLIA